MACNTEFNQEQFDAEFEAFERGDLVGFGVEDNEVEIDEDDQVYDDDDGEIDEIEDVNLSLQHLSIENKVVKISSSKNIDAVIANNNYYNWIRSNKNTTVYKCISVDLLTMALAVPRH